MKRPSPKRAMQMANVKLFKKIKEGVQWHFRKYSLARMQKAESKGGEVVIRGEVEKRPSTGDKGCRSQRKMIKRKLKSSKTLIKG